MEIEITDIFDDLYCLGKQLDEHNDKFFFDGMKDEVENMVEMAEEIEYEYDTMEQYKLLIQESLEKIATDMVDTCKAMKCQLASYQLPFNPFDQSEYDNSSFFEKIEMLFSLNNYMLALRDSRPILFAKYFPVWFHFNGEINGLLTKLCGSNGETTLWKMCMKLQLRILNFTNGLSNLIA